MPLSLLAFAALFQVPSVAAPPPITPARINGGYISDADYPRDALRAGAEGSVTAAVDVDARGRVRGCRIAQSAGNAALDARTCQIVVERFRFTPARREGRAVPSIFPFHIEWRLPQEAVPASASAKRGLPKRAIAAPPGGATTPPAPAAAERPARLVAGTISNMDYPADAIRAHQQGDTRLALSVDASGRVTGCQVTKPSGSEALDKTSCDVALARFRYEPARDPGGRAIGTKVHFTVRWQLPDDDAIDYAALLPEFGPGQMRLTLVFDGGSPRCAFEATGTAFGGGGEVLCPESMRATAAEIASSSRAILTVTTLIPEGEARPEGPPVRGFLLGTVISEIEVDPDGHLRSCRDVSAAAPRAPGPMPSVCAQFSTGMPPFRPLQGTEPRRARVDIQIYRLGANET